MFIYFFGESKGMGDIKLIPLEGHRQNYPS